MAASNPSGYVDSATVLRQIQDQIQEIYAGTYIPEMLVESGLPKPELNVSLLEAVMGRIRAEPENWDQANWACGTQRCFAGHAVELAGATIQFNQEFNESYATVCITPDGERAMIRVYAQQVLGLTAHEAAFLFNTGYYGHGGSPNSIPSTPDELHARIKQVIEDRQGPV